MFRTACSLVVLLVLSSSVAARASAQTPGLLSPPAPSPTPPKADPGVKTEERAYGHQILLVELAVIVGTLASQNAQVMAVGMVAGTPLIHALNGEKGRAWWSFGVRSAVVGLGLLIHHECEAGDSSGEPTDTIGGECGLALLFPGMAISLAMGFVEALIAKKDVPVKRDRAVRSRVNPILTPRPGGALVGLSVEF